MGLISPAFAETLTFMSWNINGGQQTPELLQANASAAVDALGTVDVVVLQEVISEDQVPRQLPRALGWSTTPSATSPHQSVSRMLGSHRSRLL